MIGVLELQTERQKIVGETVPFTITLTIGEPLDDPWSSLQDPDDLTFTISFNRTSNVTTFTYVDTSGDFEIGRLIVINQNYSTVNSTIVCDVNTTIAAATLTCAVGGEPGTYTAQGFITRNGIEQLIVQISFILQRIASEMGELGLLVGFFIILTAGFAFIYNVVAGVWLTAVACLFTQLMGFIAFGSLALSGIFGLAIIITILATR